MKYLFFLVALGTSLFSCAQQNRGYKVAATYHIASPGWWDYIVVHGGRLYVAHGTQVNILNEATGDSVGIIPHTPGVHGIAFDDALGRGYTSNGRSNTVTVFDAKTNAVMAQIAAGENPDAIMYEPFTKRIITCNGRSKDLSLIDPLSNSVAATISVGGKPETAVSDGNGMLFVNLEDKNEIAAVDLKTKAVTHHWSLQGAKNPTGLAMDNTRQRLFVGCEKQLVVMDAGNGKVIAKLPIGSGCDGVVYHAKEKIIFTANGGDGSITAIQQEAADRFVVLGNYPTRRGGRTIALNEKTGDLFIPTADFEGRRTGNERPGMVPGSFRVMVVKQ